MSDKINLENYCDPLLDMAGLSHEVVNHSIVLQMVGEDIFDHPVELFHTVKDIQRSNPDTRITVCTRYSLEQLRHPVQPHWLLVQDVLDCCRIERIEKNE